MAEKTARFSEILREMHRNSPGSSVAVLRAVESFGDKQLSVEILCATIYEAGKMEAARRLNANIDEIINA